MILLERLALMPEGTLGRLTFEDGLELWTIERPWLDNKPWVSCIPTGVYTLHPHSGTRWPSAIRIDGAHGRTAILFHPANWPSELHGCIACGMNWRFDHQQPAVSMSKKATRLLWERLGYDPVVPAIAGTTFDSLTITDAESSL